MVKDRWFHVSFSIRTQYALPWSAGGPTLVRIWSLTSNSGQSHDVWKWCYCLLQTPIQKQGR